MKPRTSYRVTVVGLVLAVLVVVLSAVEGDWLVMIAPAIAAASCINSIRSMRRRAIDWNGPTTFRELRARESRTPAERPK